METISRKASKVALYNVILKIIFSNNRGEITSITDEESRTMIIERDNMGRVTKEISPGSRMVQYVWGDTSCPKCGTDNYKLTKIIDSGNNKWEFKYDIMGNVTEMIYPDGSKITNQPIRRYIYGADMDDVDAHVELSEVTGSVFDTSRKGWYSVAIWSSYYGGTHIGCVLKCSPDLLR